MSAEFPSSNPFRRKTSATLPSAMSQRAHANPQISSYYADPQTNPLGAEEKDAPKKITKKVRVQSPPPLSPSSPSTIDSFSTVGEEIYKIPEGPLTSLRLRPEGPFDSTVSDTSEDVNTQKLHRAPANPFSKTLETMEHPERESVASIPASTIRAGRASLDVDAFKRLLMTGSSGLESPPTQTAIHPHVVNALGDGASGTDTSSRSRQSMFEPVQEPLPESPRNSHELAEPDDDRKGLMAGAAPSSTARTKPPPPSSRHGKVIKVELKDENTPSGVQTPPMASAIPSGSHTHTDLNKPLPPAPNRASHDSERDSVYDRESARKASQPPSPSQSARQKTPPAPPLTRRHSQMVSESKLAWSRSTRSSRKIEEESSRLPDLERENRRTSSDSQRAPPPPPSRRSGSVRSSSSNAIKSLSTVSLPTPPLARRTTSGGKPASVYSLDLSSSNKRSSMVAPPPPPPPRQHGRSLESKGPDNLQRTSGEYRRSTESARQTSSASSLLHEELQEEPVNIAGSTNKPDILADLSRLQHEIDTWRTSENKRMT